MLSLHSSARNLLLILALAIIAGCDASRQEEHNVTPNHAARILLVTQSAEFQHGVVTRKNDNLSAVELALTNLGISSGLFRVDCTQDVASDFTKERLNLYDIVFFYTTGPLPIDAATLDYFLNDWLKQPGHGFFGAHSATDTYKEHEPYWRMIGGTFESHPWDANSTVTITVHDRKHPLSAPWGEEFVMTDEIYKFRNWQPEHVRVLMSLNMAKTELAEPYHVPVAWVKDYGEGRVCYISLGHREEVWTNPTYVASLEGGIRWLLGHDPGDATPNPQLSADQEAKARSDCNARNTE